MRRPEIPFLQQQLPFFSKAKSLENLLETQLQLIGTRGLPIMPPQTQVRQPLFLLRRQVLRVLQPKIACVRQARILLAFLAADAVHRIVHHLHDMKFVERQLRAWEVLPHPLDERWRYVATHPLDVFASSTVFLQKCLESTPQSARVLALCGEDNLRRIQIHEERDVIVPSLAGGFVESDIANLGQIPPFEGLFRVMSDHAPEACVVQVQLPRQGLDA